MVLVDPVWLILALPLAVALWRFLPPSRLLLGLRAVTLGLAVLALAGLAVLLPSRAGTVVVVADRSHSMPAGSDASHGELIEILQSSMGGDDRLAVVTFGQSVAVERTAESGTFPGFTKDVGPDASNLGEAIEAALSLVPKGAPGRLLVLSDGRWTGRDPANLAALAAGRNLAIDYRWQSRPSAGDLAVARVEAPSRVAPGEGFLLTAWVQSPIEQSAKYDVRRDGQTIAAGDKRLVPGLNRLTFRDRATDPGSQGYTIRVTANESDPVPENNLARVLVGVTGPRPIWHLTPGPTSGLTALLRAGGLDVRPTPADPARFTLEEFSKYSAVIIENVPAGAIGTRGLETLSQWVRASGAGLMLTGGRQSYGPGGYYKSPLELILPVSMELRQEHRKLSLAIVVALDRSGSMAMPVAGGKVKMDLANLGTAEVLEMLGPMDEFGCIAVDSDPHIVCDLAPVTDKDGTRSKVLSIQSMGGGIYVYQALVAAAKMIQTAQAGTKHIVLFADTADAEEPGRYTELLEQTRKAGITVSVIGLGSPTDKDVPFLEDVARRGNGRLLITDKPEELPRLFAQDTFVIARNSFLEEPVRMTPTAGLTTLTGRSFALDQPIGGYNLCYLRPTATPGAVTADEYQAPAVATWQAGAGRVLCYTGEADGQYAGAFARSAETGEFYTSLARWVAGQVGPLTDNMAVTQEVRNGVNQIRLHLDPDRQADPFTGTPRVTTLRAKPGSAPTASEWPLIWTGPDTLTAEIPLDGETTSLSTVAIPGQKPQALPPVCLPYSPEYAPAVTGTGDADRGRTTLDRLARATGGVERVELSGIWKDLPKQPHLIPLAPWLLLAAVGVLLLEVLERRTGLVSHGGRLTRVALERVPAGRSRRTNVPAVVAPPRAKPVPSASPTPTPPPPPAAPPPPTEAGTVLDALRQARDRTRRG